jgi:hypothetical protein
MAERYAVGRAYTKRQRVRAATDLDGMRAVTNALAANYTTVQGRIEDLERRAAEHLKRAEMPLDLRAPIYGDPAWLRENERKSLEWYAFSILNTIRMLRKQIERGELWHAIDFALDLGVLAAEVKMIQYMASNPARAGKAKAALKKPAVKQSHAAWLAAADKLRKTPGKKKWGALAIAREIDPARAETIRKIIRPLWSR